MATVHVAQTAIEGWQLVVFRLRGAAKIGWMPFTLLAAIQILLLAATMIDIMAVFMRTSPYGPVELLFIAFLKFRNVASFLANFDWFTLVISAVTMVAFALLTNAWLRLVLLRDGTKRRPYLLDSARRLARTLAAMAMAALVSISIFFTVSHVEEELTPVNKALSIGVVAACVILAALLFARLSLLLPMISVNNKFDLRQAWHLTKGNGWRLLVSYALAALQAAVLVIVSTMVLGIALSGVGPAFHGNLFEVLVVSEIFQLAFVLMGFLMMVGSVAAAYRQLGGPGIGVPEATLAVFDDA